MSKETLSRSGGRSGWQWAIQVGAVAVGTALFGGACWYGRGLLDEQLITGAEFINFVIAFAVVGLTVALVGNLQEITIGGHSLKFKQVKAEADAAIKRLEEARIGTFRLHLKWCQRHSGGFADGFNPLDPRFKDFWMLYSQILSSGDKEVLRPELYQAVASLLDGQLGILQRYSGLGDQVKRGDLVEPELLCRAVLDDETFDLRHESYLKNGSKMSVETRLQEALDAYEKLYRLRKETAVA